MTSRAATALPVLFALALAGCGSVSLWPFGDSETPEKSRKPANAVEYRCGDNKAFYVRNLDGGAVWLIAPDREIRLDKLSDGRYGVGRVTLEVGGDGATLIDPPSVFSNCKRAG